MFWTRHCCICRPSNSTVSGDAGFALLRNRNRRNCNFSALAVSQKLTQYTVKLCIGFSLFNIFSFTFYNKFDITFLPCKKAYCVKRQDFSTNFFVNCFLWSRYGAGAGTGTVTCQKSEPKPELVKVGTGAVKNSYGSATQWVWAYDRVLYGRDMRGTKARLTHPAPGRGRWGFGSWVHTRPRSFSLKFIRQSSLILNPGL
jgi:hypothetical protein